MTDIREEFARKADAQDFLTRNPWNSDMAWAEYVASLGEWLKLRSHPLPSVSARAESIRNAIAAMEPFAKAAAMFAWPIEEKPNFNIAKGTDLTVKHLRNAREALAALKREVAG